MNIVLIINNYFHDLFTALLAASGFIMIFSRRVLGPNPRPDSTKFYLELYRGYARFARISLAWILIAGIPRMIYFKTYEFIPAVSKGLITALIVKHLMLFAAVAIGLFWWSRLRTEIAQFKQAGGDNHG